MAIVAEFERVTLMRIGDLTVDSTRRIVNRRLPLGGMLSRW